MIQEFRNLSTNADGLQLTPVGLSLPVPAHRARSYSIRSSLLRLSHALHSAQKPTVPPPHEIFRLADLQH